MTDQVDEFENLLGQTTATNESQNQQIAVASGQLDAQTLQVPLYSSNILIYLEQWSPVHYTGVKMGIQLINVLNFTKKSRVSLLYWL